MKISEHISLKKYNTFGIDVFAKFFAEINTEQELLELFSTNIFKRNRQIVVGGGSNILLSGDIDGLVIKNSIRGIDVCEENDKSVIIEAGAGVIWNDLVNFCVAKNWGGIENLSLIPGTAGAAPMQNIGAYGQEIKDVFSGLDGYYTRDGIKQSFSKDDCRFGYRESIFKHELKNKFIITKVRLSLSKNPVPNISYGTIRKEMENPGSKEFTIQDVSRVICKIRMEKLPDPEIIGNAGSFFKNPIIPTDQFESLKKKFPDIVSFPDGEGKVKLAAGWLIEKCGWKGTRIGNTGTHEKQSLVIVNYGGATGGEILELSEKIKASVSDKFGIVLKEEINIY